VEQQRLVVHHQELVEGEAVRNARHRRHGNADAVDA
jgi:hypothetical protein